MAFLYKSTGILIIIGLNFIRQINQSGAIVEARNGEQRNGLLEL